MVFISACFIKIKVKLRKMTKSIHCYLKNDLSCHFTYFSKTQLVILSTYKAKISLEDTSYVDSYTSLACNV